MAASIAQHSLQRRATVSVNSPLTTTDSRTTLEASWRSPLNSSDCNRVVAVIQAIDDVLRRQITRGVSSPDLGSGLAGIALFYGTLAKFNDDTASRTVAHECLAAATDHLGEMPLGPSLYGGFTGVAWAMAHLDPAASAETFAAVDDALLAHVRSRPWPCEFDLIAGLVGIGVYFLERLPDAKAVDGLHAVLARLEELAEHTDHGITWKTPVAFIPQQQRELSPDGYYNLGVAHGVPGIVSLLGSCCRHEALVHRSQDILDGAVDWLTRQRVANNEHSAFPYWTDTINPPQPARTAWCYGDPGVAAALLVAAEGSGCSSWKRFSVDIAKQATRRSVKETEVVDAPLCHGSTGLAHIYNRFWNATGDDIFREAAVDWLRRTLDGRQPGGELAGFPTWKTTPTGLAWVDEPGFLEGAAGIGLALLSAVCETPPQWDRILLTGIG